MAQRDAIHGLTINDGGLSASLNLTAVGEQESTSVPLELVQQPDSFEHQSEWGQFQLQWIEAGPRDSMRRLKVRGTCLRPMRLEFLWSTSTRLPNPFHILPGFLFGSNNLSLSGPDHFPNLTTETVGTKSCSPRWSVRADRCASPVAMLTSDAGAMAIAGPPYLSQSDQPLIRNGLIAQLPGCVGFSLGYRNHPWTYLDKNKFTDPTQQCLAAGTRFEIELAVFVKAGVSRRFALDLNRRLYEWFYQPPRQTLPLDRCISAVADALATDAWEPQFNAFQSQQTSGFPAQTTYRKLGGRAIGWVAGSNVAYPLILAGYRCQQRAWIDIGSANLNRIVQQFNPASGLLFDAFTEDWKPTVNNWWSGNTNRDLHSAYTNGHACYFLLMASRLMRSRGQTPPAAWEQTALRALATIQGLQRNDGNLGYAYDQDKPRVARWDGFAGCWWTPALILAHQLTGQTALLDAARRGLDYYGSFLPTLNVWGTPMDTHMANDQEGVLAFLRGARLMHQVSSQNRWVEQLQLAAGYEFLWRYHYNAKPQAPPLCNTDWSSCGGSLTSVSNPHIHPMGLLVSDDLRYLFNITGDQHILQRMNDGLSWAANCLALYPQNTGYGRFGWLGERFCPSDGLLITKMSDGTAASTELGMKAWAMAAVLQGMLECTE